MKAARIDRYGGPDSITVVRDADRPTLEEGQLLIEVRAASLNPVDTVIRSGHMKEMVELIFPATLGGDFAGIVAQVGRGVSGFEVDDEVYGQASTLLGGSGSLAEAVAAQAGMTAHKPKSVDFNTAASLPLVGCSAIQAIMDHLNVQEGQRILIHGAAGGIGAIAVQVARHLGAHVIGTALTADVELVEELGADEVIDTSSSDFTTKVREVDGALDTVGGDVAAKSYSVIRRGGTLVSMTAQPDEARMQETGVKMISQFTQPTTDRLTRLAKFVDDGVVTPHVGKVFPLDRTADAFTFRENEKPSGKVIVAMQADQAS